MSSKENSRNRVTKSGRDARRTPLPFALQFCFSFVIPPLALLVLSGCHTSSAPISTVGNASIRISGTQSGNSSSANQVVALDSFDGARAFALLKKQCDFGVRPLGSPAHEKTRDFLLSEMRKYADNTVIQASTYRMMPVTNIVGVFYPSGASHADYRPVLLMAHWDTRPIADGPFSSEIKRGTVFRYGAEGWNPVAPILGADDGASGVAVLLELARIFKARKPAVGVIMLLDDGEDYGDFEARNNDGEGVELGARYFAKHFGETPAFGQPRYGILLDMVGGKGAFFPREEISERFAPRVNEKVFAIANELGYGNTFRGDLSQGVGDDHVAINQAGIPTIDLIHPLPFGSYQSTGYRYWHTLQDTPENCSAKPLEAVGRTVAETIYREPLKP